MSLRLHGYWRSGAAWRVRIALNLKGLAWQHVPVPLRVGAQRSPEYLALNPQGLVPALDPGTGGPVLTQSLAIVEWLEETHPAPPLLPPEPALRAEVRGFAQIIACDTHPLQNLRVLNYLRGPLGADEAAVSDWLQHWISAGLKACEALAVAAARRHGGDFVFGDAPGLADLCLIPQLGAADRFCVSLAALPRLAAIRAACEALPAFETAHPLRQPDAD